MYEEPACIKVLYSGLLNFLFIKQYLIKSKVKLLGSYFKRGKLMNIRILFVIELFNKSFREIYAWCNINIIVYLFNSNVYTFIYSYFLSFLFLKKKKNKKRESNFCYNWSLDSRRYWIYSLTRHTYKRNLACISWGWNGLKKLRGWLLVSPFASGPW